jgi:hypothetical protein
MMKPVAAPLALLALGAVSVAGCWQRPGAITQDELVRRTQQIYDAVAIGGAAPIEEYFAADSMIFDEHGRSMDKKAFVADQAPLPAGYSGSISVVRPHGRILGDTAILSFDLDETESVFGQALKARYHETDTWLRRHGQWQIVAEQIFRYYEDPAPGTPDPKHYPDYVGSYQLAPGITRSILIDGNALVSQRTGKPADKLISEAPDIFFRTGVEGRMLFRRDAAGRVDALIDRRNNEDIVWTRVQANGSTS